ncbi:MAG: OadG family transporter subunit [Lachnospiraceae bacterium]|nr:OadG family transporter subunit [Lachnospiraceae bacterium]
MTKFTKKLLKTVLMLTCVLSLTACGKDESISDVQQQKLTMAESKADVVIALTDQFVTTGETEKMLSDYNNVELAALYRSTYYGFTQDSSFECEGKAVRNAFTSFASAKESLGAVTELGDKNTKIDGETIVITVPAKCENGSGQIELIFTNDVFAKMTSCTFNVDETFGELMGRAGLNTLLGMGTVFVVLILISFIISIFGIIPKIQESLAKKNEPAKEEPVVVEETAVVEEEDLSDDMELVAVIAAAIAAYEGAASTEGFRVRSIKRANSNKWKNA